MVLGLALNIFFDHSEFDENTRAIHNELNHYSVAAKLYPRLVI